MYLDHFGLRELPFGITPDTSFAFAGAAHQEALNTLLLAMRAARASSRSPARSAPARRCSAAACWPRWARIASPPTCPIPTWSRAPCCWRWPRNCGVELDEECDHYHLRPAHQRAVLEYARQEKTGGALHRRGAGDADGKPGIPAAAVQSGNGKAQAAAAGAVRPAGTRRALARAVGAAVAPAHFLPLPPRRPAARRDVFIPGAPPACRGLSRPPPVRPGIRAS
jgi:hypothetical protein